MKLLLQTNLFALLTLLLPATVNGLVTDCAVAEGWGVRLLVPGSGSQIESRRLVYEYSFVREGRVL
jgi:hypothetical protein